MKIAYLINQYPWVSHSFIRREIRALEALGIQVERFSIRAVREADLPDPHDHDELQRTRAILSAGALGLLLATLLTLLTRPPRFLATLGLALRTGFRSHRGMIAQLIYLTEACTLLRTLASTGITHIHAHFGTNSATVAMLTHALGGPTFSITVHGPEEFDKPEALALPEKIKRAAFVAAISHFGKSQLMRWCPPEHWHKLHVIRCTVDRQFLDHAQPIRDTNKLVCVGRIGYEKGQLLLLDAFAALPSDSRPQLVFVGDGPLRQQLQQRIDDHNLNDHVTITGWQSGDVVRQHMLDARVFILPTFAEGLPVVIMEALALQRPVLTTYIAGIPELVRHDENGWLIPAASVEALTHALQRVLQTPVEQLQTMGQAGADLVAIQHYDEREAERLAALLRARHANLMPGTPVVRSRIQFHETKESIDA